MSATATEVEINFSPLLQTIYPYHGKVVTVVIHNEAREALPT